MAKRYIANDTKNVLFIGGTMIPAGEGREVDEQFLPPADNPEAVADGGAGDGAGDGKGLELDLDAARLAANLADLLKQPVKKLVPALKEASDDTLAALASAEQASETPRVTLLNAIAELQLWRAQKRAGGEAG